MNKLLHTNAADLTRERIVERLGSTGKTAAGASKEAGKSPTYLRDFLAGRSKTMTVKNMEAIARVLETTPQYLSGDSERTSRPTQLRTLPVLGTAAGSLTGAWQFTGEIIETFPVPPGLDGVRDAYALYVTGESMLPAFKPRDPVFVNPNHPVRSGDIVVVQEERDGDTYAWVKEFTRNDETHIVTRQYNPDGEVKFNRRYVISVHRVLPVAEVLGL